MRLSLIVLLGSSAVLPIVFCLIRVYYYQFVIDVPVVAVYSIKNYQDNGLYDHQLFRVVARGKADFILKLYLKDYLSDKVQSLHDLENMDFIQSSSYSCLEGVWKVDFFVFCSKQHACLFVSNRPDVDKSQINNIEIKNDENNSKRIRWIVSPMGYDYDTTKINLDVMCGIITGLDEGRDHGYQRFVGEYQVMVGIDY
jgi:hypothetical protein